MTEIFNKKTETEKRKILRNNMPIPEKILWSKLKNRQLSGYKFRRQCSINRYVVDFYCPVLKLAVEIDGDSHFISNIKQYDQNRQKFIEALGIKFLRFTNSDVIKNLDSVLEKIFKTTPNPSFVRRGDAKLEKIFKTTPNPSFVRRGDAKKRRIY